MPSIPSAACSLPLSLNPSVIPTPVMMGLDYIGRERVEDRAHECWGKSGAWLEFYFTSILLHLLSMKSPLVIVASL